jgi:hypothetical protein
MMRNEGATHIDTTGIEGIIPANPKWGFSNIDLIGERKGRFLVQEWKRPNEQISTGQRILLEQLAKQPAFTVLVVTGHTAGTAMTVHAVHELIGGKAQLIATTTEAFRECISVWYGKVERGEI